MAKFEEVNEAAAEVVRLPSQTVPPARETGLDMKLLGLALATISQRALTAISDLFALMVIGSVWWLFLSVASPNPFQLAALAGFAMFALAAIWIVKRRG